MESHRDRGRKPETLRAWLPREGTKTPTIHVYDHTETINVMTWRHWFRCQSTGQLRVWGLDGPSCAEFENGENK